MHQNMQLQDKNISKVLATRAFEATPFPLWLQSKPTSESSSVLKTWGQQWAETSVRSPLLSRGWYGKNKITDNPASQLMAIWKQSKQAAGFVSDRPTASWSLWTGLIYINLRGDPTCGESGVDTSIPPQSTTWRRPCYVTRVGCDINGEKMKI